MSSTPLSPEKRAAIAVLIRAIHEAVGDEIAEFGANLATIDDADLVGENEIKVRAVAHTIAAKALEQHLARKKPSR